MERQRSLRLGDYCQLTGYTVTELKLLLLTNNIRACTSTEEVSEEAAQFLNGLIGCALQRSQPSPWLRASTITENAQQHRRRLLQNIKPAAAPPPMLTAGVLSENDRRTLSHFQTVVLTVSVLFREETAGFLRALRTAVQRDHLRIRLAVLRPMLERCAERLGEYFQYMQHVGLLIPLEGTPAQEVDIICRFHTEHAGEGTILTLAEDTALAHRLNLLSKEQQVTTGILNIRPDGTLTADADPASYAVFDAQTTAAAVAEGADKRIPIRGVHPSTGTTVHTADGKRYVLGEQLGDSGGEGAVYAVNDRYCVKIFHPDANTVLRHRKVQVLIERAKLLRKRNPRLAARFAFPIAPVYNAVGDAVLENPVGYLMKRFCGCEQLAALSVRMLPKLIPNCTKLELIRMSESLCELTVFAAVNNLVLGDVLAGENLLVDPKTCCVYCCDTDSMQFADQGVLYPSNMGRDGYKAPEHIRETGVYLRTSADDVWALQILLFQVLVGSDPYVGVKSEGLEQDVVDGRYCYQNGVDDREYGLPLGENGWYYKTMSHLPRFVQRAFYNAFANDGANFRKGTRKTAEQWLRTIAWYHQCYDRLLQRDADAGSVKPTHAMRRAS